MKAAMAILKPTGGVVFAITGKRSVFSQSHTDLKIACARAQLLNTWGRVKAEKALCQQATVA